MVTSPNIDFAINFVFLFMCRNPFNYKVSCDTKVIINVCLFYHHLLVSDVIIADLTPYLDPNYLLILVT